MVTWNCPSSSRASGATIMPPPKYFPFAITSVVTARSSSGAPSNETRMRTSRQVAAGPGREHRRGGVGADRPGRLAGARRKEEPVHDFVDGPVSADGDHQVVTGPQGLAREVRRVHRALGEDMVDVAHRAPHRLHDAVEMPRGRAVRGARIDDQEGFQRVPCASQRARTETTSVAPRAAAQAGLEVTAAPPNSARRSS